jgi:tetratricopeptide (TPR) repeat protein
MWTLLLVSVLAAAPAPASAPDSDASAAPDTAALSYRSEEALRHYVQGRWLEQTGKLQEAQAEFSRALSLDPGATSIALHLCELSANSGEPGRALELADRVLAREPGNPRALWLRGAALFNLERPAEAIVPLEAACRADSMNADYVKTYARVAESLDRLPEVAAAWGRATRLDEGDPEAWFQLASAAARLGDFALADSALDRSVEMNPVRPGVLFLRGWIRENTGRDAEAIDLYRHHLSIHSSDLETRRRLVVLLGRNKRYAEAYQEARRLAEARPDSPDVLQLEAETALAAGHADAGERILERMRALAPADPDLVLRSTVVLARHDRGRAGVKVADEWAAARPHDARGLSLSARARALAGEYDSAAVYARRAVEAAPESLDARRLLARIYQDGRRWPEAVAAWREARALSPGDPLLMLDMGFCLEQSGDIEGAIALGREALQHAPDFPGALNFLGYLLADNNRELPQALELIQRALQQDPGNGAYLDSYGWVLYRLGRLDEARVQLESALAQTGGDAVVHEHLGDVYRDLKMVDRAREQYRASLQADTHNARVRNKLDQLR